MDLAILTDGNAWMVDVSDKGYHIPHSHRRRFIAINDVIYERIAGVL